MDDNAVFDAYLQLLRRLIARRGGDPDAETVPYRWPNADRGDHEAPKAATSLSPLLTGGPHLGDVDAPSRGGAVAVPPGLEPPKA